MKPEHFIWIEQYFDGQLDDQTRKEVEDLVETDAEFKAEFELHKASHLLIDLKTLSDLKDSVQKMDEERTSNSTRKFWKPWLAAASVVLIGVVGGLFYAQSFSDGNLYDAHFVAAKDYVSDLGSQESDLSLAMTTYNQKEFNQSEKQFLSLVSDSSHRSVARFYLGQIYLQTDEFSKAVDQFKLVEGMYSAEAKWYLALGYLASGDDAKARQTLEEIIQSNDDPKFVQSAKKLQGKLESPLRGLVWE
jgi:FimV-like protein